MFSSRSLTLKKTGVIAYKAAIPQQASSRVHQIQRQSLNYKPIKYIGKGAFGVVYLTRSPVDHQLVAVKKVKIDPRFKMREIDIMKMISHPNCIALKTIFKTRGESDKEFFYNIVMEYMPVTINQYNLSFRGANIKPPKVAIKLFAFQMFSGLHYLHSNGIMHRDIKPQNLLVDPDKCTLKICDFGSAKTIHKGDTSVSYIASRFYRAPELLFGCTSYNEKVDIWAAGCVIAEMMMSGRVLFAGKSTEDQLYEIVKVLGLPTDEDLSSFPHNTSFDFINVSILDKNVLEDVLVNPISKDLVELLKMIFVYNPNNRPSALKCLEHPCFDELFESSTRVPNGNPIPPISRDPLLL